MGNMSFSWTGMTLLPRLLREGRLVRFLAASRALLRNGTRLGTIASQSFGPFLPETLWGAVARLRGKGGGLADYSLVNPEAARRLAIRDRAAARGLDLSYRPRADGPAARLWALGRVDPGNFNKGTLGGWGIDMRDPTADRRLVELCLTISDEQFLMGGVPRGLARFAFADRLPPAVVGERRKGYQAADWHEGIAGARAALAEEVERIAAAPAAAETLDTLRMRRLLDEWPERGWNHIGTIQRYRAALLRGVSAGHFARRASGRND
jgi:asparagine synthase (glutamine-hydrolysing)